MNTEYFVRKRKLAIWLKAWVNWFWMFFWGPTKREKGSCNKCVTKWNAKTAGFLLYFPQLKRKSATKVERGREQKKENWQNRSKTKQRAQGSSRIFVIVVCFLCNSKITWHGQVRRRERELAGGRQIRETGALPNICTHKLTWICGSSSPSSALDIFADFHQSQICKIALIFTFLSPAFQLKTTCISFNLILLFTHTRAHTHRLRVASIFQLACVCLYLVLFFQYYVNFVFVFN